MKHVLILMAAFFAVSAQAAAPKYTMEKFKDLVGNYEGNNSCTGGFDLCDQATLKLDEAGKALIIFGDSYYGSKVEVTEITAKNGRILFSADIESDCDDPGCGNLISVRGVIYPKKVGRKYVPVLKGYVTTDFPYPDEDDSPVGFVEDTFVLSRQ